MTELTSKLMELIDECKTVNEISKVLKLSNKKIYSRITTLQRKGFEFNKKYYYNGDIVYIPNKKYQLFNNEKINNSNISIITSPQQQNFEALIISDLHLGSINERVDLLKQAYDYCKKNGINIIIVCGDIIDGMYGPYDKIHDNIALQIEYAIKNYPFDKNILNFATLGDHDYDAMQNYGQNFATVLENYRHDIVPLGYCYGKINIKNDNIIVTHPSNKYDFDRMINYPKGYLSLCGHSHRLRYAPNNCGTIIYIPALSNMPFNNKKTIPTAVRMKLNFNNGIIYNGEFTQLIFDDNVYEISEMFCELGHFKERQNLSTILNEEEVNEKNHDLTLKKTLL